jgi:hypothetical protein
VTARKEEIISFRMVKGYLLYFWNGDNMRNHKKYILILLCLVVCLSACSKGNNLSNEEAEKVFEFADPIAENMLASLKTGDYAAYTRDFTDEMKNATSEAAFRELKQLFDAKLGEFQYDEADYVIEDANYFPVVYVLQFENAPAVTMRLVLTKTEPHLIAGTWFDSPELRK